MLIDNEKFIPDRKQRNWMAAQAHIIERDGLLDESLERLKLEGKEVQRPNTEYLGAKDAYDYQINKLQKIDADANSIFDSFLAEKALNINRIE